MPASNTAVELDTAGLFIAPLARGAALQTRDALELFARHACADREVIRMLVPDVKIRGTSGDDDEETGKFTAVINTDDIDRYQSIVDPAGGVFDDYRANPVLQYMHGLDQVVGSWPVGRVLELRRNSKEIEVDLEFDLKGALHGDQSKKLGAELARLYREKWLRGFSVGFIPVSYEMQMIDEKYVLKYTAWELVELSCVLVPGNQKALARALADGSITDEGLRQSLARVVDVKAAEDQRLADQRATEQPACARESVQTVAREKHGKKLAGEQTIKLRGGMSIRLDMDDFDMADEHKERLLDLLRDATVMPGDVDGGPTETIPTKTAPAVEAKAVEAKPAEHPANRNAFPIEWDANWDLQAEAKAASPKVRAAMAAITIDGRDGSTVPVAVHHHADGRLSWRALAFAMTRLLTQPANLTREQKDQIYQHLAEHYRQLDIAPPEPGAKTPEQAYDLALDGRLALIDSAGYGWLYVEPVQKSGRLVPGFQRIDDPKALRLGHVPGVGRLNDHRHWGKRSVGELPRDEALLQELAANQRMLAEVLETREGKAISKANKEKIRAAADHMEEVAKALKGHTKTMGAHIECLRDLLGDDDYSDDSEFPGDKKSAASAGRGQLDPGAGDGAQPTRQNQAGAKANGSGRPLA